MCAYIALGFTVVAVHAGNGRHFATLTPTEQSDAILYTMAGFLPSILSFGLPKLAVVALLTKIVLPSRRHRYFMWFITTLCTLMLVACIVVMYARCTPARSQWDFSVKGRCWSPWILVRFSVLAGSKSHTNQTALLSALTNRT